MIYNVKGSSANHKVDTQLVTCSCMDFKMRHRDVYAKTDERRWCKHLKQFKGEINVLHGNQGVTVRPVGPYSKKGNHPRHVIQVLQEQIVNWMVECPNYNTVNFEFCGSWRRGAQTIGDIDLLIAGSATIAFHKAFVNKLKKECDEILLDGDKKSAFLIEGVQVDVRVIPQESWGAALLHYTGPMEENIRLRKIARAQGLHLSEYGLSMSPNPDRILNGLDSERKIYEALGEPYKEPNQR